MQFKEQLVKRYDHIKDNISLYVKSATTSINLHLQDLQNEHNPDKMYEIISNINEDIFALGNFASMLKMINGLKQELDADFLITKETK